MERELGPIRFEFSSNSINLFERHTAMRNALYRKIGQRADYCIGWEGEVLRKLRETEVPEFRSVLNVLFAGSKPVAAHFGLISRGVFHWWFPAYGLTAHRYSPGLQLIDHCARHAADEGIVTIDFGKGDDRYKSLFADCNVEMLRGSVCSDGSVAGWMRVSSSRLLALAEEVLPASIGAYPRRLVERLWTGTMLPRRS